jgi:hypothetical protein
MMAARVEYVPGVCNIGQAEIRRRRRSGWIGLGATILLEAVLAAFRVPAPWRLFLFLPASLGAAGFLQAALHFCAGFGMQGVFNFGPQVGRTEAIEQEADRIKDIRKARRIGLYSALIGIAVAILGFALPF